MRQIVYFSYAINPMSDARLVDLLNESRTNNLIHSVTGLLIYAGQHFIQAIEGEDRKIGQLIKNIREDDRNTNVTVLIDRAIDSRAFPGWSMGFKAMDVKTLCDVEGGLNIRTVADLEAIEHADRRLFSIMRNIYLINVGRIRNS